MSDSPVAIHAEHVSKLFYITKNASNYPTLREVLQGIFNSRTTTRDRIELWALKNVSFTIKRQDRIGILGLNGAGKSTLLKVLSRVLVPTSGRVRIYGRISSLLELGTGFHPDLSGRDNIYLNGAILGMSRAETRKVYDDILSFSEIEKFIDTPIKFYSSGMQARLGFAVAAHLNADILIVDEVLSVGDAVFQQKCLKRMQEICRSGKTIIFVSHGLKTVRDLCNRAILLTSGKVHAIGAIDEVADQYVEMNKNKEADSLSWTGKVGVDELEVTSLSIQTQDKSSSSINQKTPLVLSVYFEVFERIKELTIGIEIINHNDHTIAASYYPLSTNTRSNVMRAGAYCAQAKFDFSLFTGGNYTIAFLATKEHDMFLIRHKPAIQIFIDDGLKPILEQSRASIAAGLTHPQDWRWNLLK